MTAYIHWMLIVCLLTTKSYVMCCLLSFLRLLIFSSYSQNNQKKVTADNWPLFQKLPYPSMICSCESGSMSYTLICPSNSPANFVKGFYQIDSLLFYFLVPAILKLWVLEKVLVFPYHLLKLRGVRCSRTEQPVTVDCWRWLVPSHKS